MVHPAGPGDHDALQVPRAVLVGSSQGGRHRRRSHGRRRLPDATFEVTDGVAHLPGLERPAVLARRIRELVARCDPDS